MSDVYVHLFGPKHSGKTVLLYLLNRFLDGEMRFEYMSPDMIRQRDLMNGRQPTAETAPTAEESVRFRWTARNQLITVVSHPAEKMYDDRGAIDIPKVLSLFHADNTYLVAVANPFLSDEQLAYSSLLDMIWDLQNRVNLSLSSSVQIAANILFHVKPPDGLIALHVGYDQARLDALADARITYQEETKTFGWEQIDDGEMRWLVAVLRKLSQTVVVQQRNGYLDPLREVVGQMRSRTTVVLTHLDLVRYMPHQGIEGLVKRTEGFFKVLDYIFGEESDRQVSQEVLAANLDIKVRDDVLNPVVFDDELNEGARQLWRSIKVRTTAPEAAPPRSQQDRLGWGDVLATAAFRALGWFPWLVAAVLLVPLIAWLLRTPMDSFSPVGALEKIGWGALALAAAAVLLGWFAAQLAPPRWRFNAPHLTLWKPVAGTVSVPLSEVRIEQSLTSRLFGQGWAVIGENHVRRFRLPQVRQLLGLLKGNARVRTRWLPDATLALALLAVLVLGVWALAAALLH